ncbi:hypothetical protein J6590_051246 [Homalodisca vitripennis]|nr:hypothetical protein J6590_051246 [Homalodisca vitripennis]
MDLSLRNCTKRGCRLMYLPDSLTQCPAVYSGSPFSYTLPDSKKRRENPRGGGKLSARKKLEKYIFIQIQRLSQDNQTKQRLAWVLLRWDRSDPVLESSLSAQPLLELVCVHKESWLQALASSNRREKSLHYIKRVRSQTRPVSSSKHLLQVLTSMQERFVLVFRLLLTKPVRDKQLCSMDVDELITQVFRRGAIWDKRLKLHGNRVQKSKERAKRSKLHTVERVKRVRRDDYTASI